MTMATVSNRHLVALLHTLGACSEGRNWLGTRDLTTAWTECERGDHLLWVCARIAVDRRLLVRAAAACAETALQFVPEDEARPRTAIEAARAWADDPSEDTRQKARQVEATDVAYAAYADAAAYAAEAAASAASAAYAASAADAASYASFTSASYAASYAADAASAASASAAASADAASYASFTSASYAASYAADAAAYAAAYDAAYDANAASDAAESAARREAHHASLKQCADLVREHIPFAIVLTAVQARIGGHHDTA